jgi:hypothetical protein
MYMKVYNYIGGNERQYYLMTDSQQDLEDRKKEYEESRENSIRIDAIFHAAFAIGFVWFLFNGLINGSVELLEQFMRHGLALTYTVGAAIGFSLLFMYRATTGKSWFERFSLTEDLWRSDFSSYLYGLIFYILLVHAFIIPVACMIYFIETSTSLWTTLPVTLGIEFGYLFFVIKFLAVFAKWLRVKGA